MTAISGRAAVVVLRVQLPSLAHAVARSRSDAMIKRSVEMPSRRRLQCSASATVGSTLPGVVTYATKANLTSKVKVLTVDDKAAGELGYALQPRVPRLAASA